MNNKQSRCWKRGGRYRNVHEAIAALETEERGTAARVLASCANPAITSYLLDHDNPMVRLIGATGIHWVSFPQAIALYCKALLHEDEKVSLTAAKSLVRRYRRHASCYYLQILQRIDIDRLPLCSKQEIVCLTEKINRSTKASAY